MGFYSRVRIIERTVALLADLSDSFSLVELFEAYEKSASEPYVYQRILQTLVEHAVREKLTIEFSPLSELGSWRVTEGEVHHGYGNTLIEAVRDFLGNREEYDG